MAKLMKNVYENISENEILLGDSNEDLFDDNDDDGGELVK